jgi:lactate dehydrogenase-like 2-hydroxyacid dehydrogenase
MNGKILVTGSSVEPRLLEPLAAAGLSVTNPTHLLTETELSTALSDAVGYLLGGDEVASAPALANAKQLRVIAFLGVGYQSFIDVMAATSHGIRVTNTPGTLTDSVAEFTVGQLVNLRRQLTHYSNLYRAGRSGSEEKQSDLRNHSIGILGLGAIGTRIAEILKFGFGSDVVYYSRTRKPHEEARLGIRYEELQAVVNHVEALIVMTPGDESTHHLLNSSILDSSHPGMLLINTARPNIVDPEALRSALRSGAISRAAFDGFYDEPVASELIKEFDEARLIVTGHIASLTDDARDAMARMSVRSILNVLETGTDAHVVNV